MFVEALKQFVYGWIIDWIRKQLEEAEKKHAKK